MIRWTVLVSILASLGCGSSPEPVETTDEVAPPDDLASGGEAPPPATSTETTEAAAGGTEGSGLGGDLVGRCRELVGSGRPGTCVIDALVENASCGELPELVDCLGSVGSDADRQDRARVLEESCP